MKIALGSDHAGLKLKNLIIDHLNQNNIEVEDFGTYSSASVDYPDYASKVATAVKNNEADFGILVCYTGIGMSIAANKVPGIRASLVFNTESATLTREHNNANVLCLSEKDISEHNALAIVDCFLKAEFLGERHLRRVNKICDIEKTYEK